MLVKMGKVRVTDVAIAEEEFKKFDSNGDGWLTREDLAIERRDQHFRSFVLNSNG